MLKIDGSHGEGGGQILRTAVGLSVLLKKPLRISKIRENRPKKGLSPQHLFTLNALGNICGAKTKGLFLRSREILFEPQSIEKKRLKVEIPTAGSVTLVLQALTIPASFHGLSVYLKGGTDVSWSPPFDYLKNVTLKTLEKMGVRSHGRLFKRGYYPRGGGSVEIEIHKTKVLKPLVMRDFSKVSKIHGISHSSIETVAERQKKSARKFLLENSHDAKVQVEKFKGPKGSGITLWAETDQGFLASSALGKKGKPAEVVGREAAKVLLSYLENKTMDRHLGDQLIPYMALAKGKSEIVVSKLTEHLKTNIWVCEKFLDSEFEIEDNIVRVEGMGFSVD